MAPPPPPPPPTATTASRGAAANTGATSTSASRKGSSTSTKPSSRPSSTMFISSPQHSPRPSSSSPRPRSSSAVSVTDSLASSSVPSSPRAPRSAGSNTVVPATSTAPSRTSFFASSKSTDRLAPLSPSHNSRPASISNSHDPQLTPTPSSRKHSLSSSSSMTSLAPSSSLRPASGDYRYSLGPAPVRFPKATNNAQGVDTRGAGMLSASPTSSIASTSTSTAARRHRTPSPTASRSRSTSSNSYLAAPPSSKEQVTGSSKAEQQQRRPTAEEGLLDDQEATPRPTRPPSQLATISGAFPGGRLTSLDAKDKRSSTRTSSSATLRGNYVGSPSNRAEELTVPSGSSTTGMGPASSPAAEHHLQRPEMPPRPSSKVLTTFPFPHPTTPRGTSDEDGRHLPNLLGFSWVSKLFGGAGGQATDKEGEGLIAPHREARDLESRALLSSQEAPSGPSHNSTVRGGVSDVAGVGYGTISPSSTQQLQQLQSANQSQSRHPSHAQQPRRNPSLSSLATSEPDPSDPYGYRRLAGPDLLPTYHADHVHPRRRKREMQRRWEKRRRIWMAVGACLLLLGLLFVGAKAWGAIQDGREDVGGGGEGGGGEGGGAEEGESGDAWSQGAEMEAVRKMGPVDRTQVLVAPTSRN